MAYGARKLTALALKFGKNAVIALVFECLQLRD